MACVVTDQHPSAFKIVMLLCAAQVLAMTGFATYPALLTRIMDAWKLSGAEAGLVGGAFFFGYMVAVPFLSGLTDRMDARLVFAMSCVLAAMGSAGFGWFAGGVASGVFFQALTGAGLAGTYMPGLKAMTDRVQGPSQSRYVSFYTATFGLGASVSLLLAGWCSAVLSPEATFVVASVFPLVAIPMVIWSIRPHQPVGGLKRWWPSFSGVWSQVAVRQYIIGYAVHCWELFGLRSWQVAFFAFAFGMSATQAWVSPTEAAAILNLLGLPASILGNEMAARLGRQRWIGAIMLASGVLAWVAGASSVLPWMLTLAVAALYNVVVMADSASLTAGLVAESDPSQRGAAMALYSLGGFGAGFVAPVVFGAVLDHTGGHQSPLAWTLAMGALGLGGLLWSLRLRWARQRAQT